MRSRVSPRGVATLALSVLMGCASARVDTVRRHGDGEPLPRPDLVYVYDFAVNPDDVTLDNAIGKKIARPSGAAAQSAEQLRVAKAVAGTLAQKLVEEIQALGMPAERTFSVPVAPRHSLVIEGQFVSIDQGNRTQRLVIGFGLGSTQVRTRVQVYQASDGVWRPVEEFQTIAQGSQKPGMAAPVGVGAMAGRAAVSAAVSGTASVVGEAVGGVEADAQRTAVEIAKRLALLFVRQGWIPADAAGR